MVINKLNVSMVIVVVVVILLTDLLNMGGSQAFLLVFDSQQGRYGSQVGRCILV